MQDTPCFGDPLPWQPRAIGTMHSPLRVHHDAPRQPRERGALTGQIHLLQGFQNCVHDLEGFSHLWVLWLCHHTRGWNAKVMPPRDHVKRGLFATRAPARPNPIGLSCVRLLRVAGRVLTIGDHDVLDGSPILDLKPYLPYCDSVPDARVGYVAELVEDAGDHRAWWEEKGVEPPRVYRGSAENGDAPSS